MGSGIVEAKERCRGLGREPVRSGGNDDAGAFAVPAQLIEPGAVWELGPEVEPSLRDVFNVGLRSMLAQAGDQQVPACLELVAEAAQVGLPGGLGDYVQCRALEQAADIHGFGAAVGKDAFPRRPRAITAATRIAGDTLLVNERR
jgi:hypothetical protein